MNQQIYTIFTLHCMLEYDFMSWLIVIEILYPLLIIAICINIILETSSSVKASAYVLLVLLIPLAGIAIYLSVGLNYRKRGIYTKKLITDMKQAIAVLRRVEHLKEENTRLFNRDYERYNGLNEMLFADNQSLLTQNNHVELLINGEEKFPALLRSLKEARHHIHIEYYIYENDHIGNQIAEVLIEKAREGVQVRFIYDDFGSRSIRGNIAKTLKQNGVEAYPFFKVRFIPFANRFNYRNHRKIVIIDAETAYVGGINVSDKYINSHAGNLFWRDTHLQIKGQAVLYLQRVFLADWNFCSEQQLTATDEFFASFKNTESHHPTWIQIAASGPDSVNPSILYSHLFAIHNAQRQLLITTPYFIPGQEFIEALRMAVLRGVEVKLLVPGISDSRFTNAASKAHYEDLLQIGVRIFLYQKGFVHAKTLVCDGELSLVGTANLDHRSFDLNFEVNAIAYDVGLASKLQAVFLEDLKDAEEITYVQWKNRPFGARFLGKFIRLAAPLL